MNKNSSLQKKFIEITGVPEEVAFGVPLLTMIGSHEIRVSNYRGVLEYNDYLIRILSKYGQIKVEGTKLKIEYYTIDEMKITGNISNIHYENKGE